MFIKALLSALGMEKFNDVNSSSADGSYNYLSLNQRRRRGKFKPRYRQYPQAGK